MRVKKFVASNMQEAMWMVKTDLGTDALILHTRKFRQGGIMGFFSKDMVEVTAATAEPLSNGVVKEGNRSNETLHEIKNIEHDRQYNQLQQELSEVKQMISRLQYQGLAKQTTKEEQNPNLTTAYYVLTEMSNELLKNEVEQQLVERIITQVIDQLEEHQLQDFSSVRKSVFHQLINLLNSPIPIQANQGPPPQVITFVGPTGVGKTTTIAKLSAKFSLIEKRKVALVTADTYRISAVSQLKKYAEIIDVPLAVAYTPNDMQNILKQQQDKEIILVDTAGRSPGNNQQLSELRSYLDIDLPTYNFLVLSATTKYSDLIQIYEKFNTTQIDRILFTKLDETLHCGGILNLKVRTSCPLSYITTGQNVPDDIELAAAEKIAKLILRES